MIHNIKILLIRQVYYIVIYIYAIHSVTCAALVPERIFSYRLTFSRVRHSVEHLLRFDFSYKYYNFRINMQLHFIKSQRGAKRLCEKGFIYNNRGENNGTVTWRCTHNINTYNRYNMHTYLHNFFFMLTNFIFINIGEIINRLRYAFNREI